MTITVAHVNLARGYRGGERQTELLIRELARADIRQILVARRYGPLADRVEDADVEVRTVSGSRLAVTRAIREVDLVHVHEGRSVYSAYLRALLSRTPYIVTRRVNNPIHDHWLAHRAYQRAAYVVAVASQVAEVVLAFDPAIRSRVIHSASSGLSVDDARSAAIRGADPGKLLVGHVGALDIKQKGQDLIIQVARELQETHPDVRFLLVGGGDDEAMLRRSAKGLHNLAFAGFVDNVGDYLAAFDVLILPSYKEGIGSILLDAMEQRLPIVASRVGGVPEIVHDGDNGILIDPARPDQLKAALLRLYDQPELRRELGINGERIARSYTAEVMGRRYLDLYRSVVDDDRSGRLSR
jgi:glycosyltransferase involved in cell wall biosynthesis